MRFVLVAVGGALAALTRYSASLATGVRSFPYATLGVNVTGAMFYGVVTALMAAGRIPKDLGTAATVGFLGAYTTFATFAWEVFSLLRAHRLPLAAGYICLSVTLGVVAAGGGYTVTRTLTS